MSVSNGQDANQGTFNGSFMSRVTDTSTVGKVALSDASSGDLLVNIQQLLNDLKESSGFASEVDANKDDYGTPNYLTNGTSRKQGLIDLDAQIKINEDDIASNLSNITSNSTDIANIQNLVTPTLARKLVNLADDAAYESAYGTPTGGELYWNTTDFVGRVYNQDSSAWEDFGSGGGGGTWNEEIITLIAGDITNGYVDLSFEITPNSLTVIPKGAPVQIINDDYTLSTVSLVTRVTFAGDMTDNLAAGDKIRFHYQYIP